MYQGVSVILLPDEGHEPPAVTDGADAGTQQQWPARQGCGRRYGRDIMHPMFVKLFIETDPDDELAEEDRRRRARPSRRARPAMAVRPAARDRRPGDGR